MGSVGEIGTVWTTVNYDILGPDEIYKVGTASLYRDRPFDVKQVEVHDIRGHESDFTLDGRGFELHSHNLSFNNFTDEEETKKIGWPQVAEFLRTKLHASQVVPFSHIHRHIPYSAAASAARTAPHEDAPVSSLHPARWVHIDQSRDGALIMLKDILPDTWQTLSAHRWAIINVWRPLSPLILKDPLALVDGSTVADADLVPKSVRFPARQGGMSHLTTNKSTHQVCAVAANPAHKWYFASNMTDTELLLIKIFDSKTDGRVRAVPHTSFVDARYENDPSVPDRASVETRCFVFWDDQGPE